LVCFIIKFKILTENQYGFQKNKPTISAGQSFVGNAQEAFDRQSFAVGGIFFDLTNAYDVINHYILLEVCYFNCRFNHVKSNYLLLTNSNPVGICAKVFQE
jgi:hypothetical protein